MGARVARRRAHGARQAWPLAATLLLLTCYRPDLADCVISCAVGACPHGMRCSNGFCTRDSQADCVALPPAAECQACDGHIEDYKRCLGNIVLRCRGSKWLASDSPCAGACVDGLCVECRPGTSSCVDGCEQPCSSDGTRVEVASCTPCPAQAPASMLAAGWSHSCALAGGELRCWGANASGQLGMSAPPAGDAGDEPGEVAALPAIDLGPGVAPVAVAAGGRHTCALLDSGDVKCWGANESGQLGLGDTATRGDDPGEMGILLPFVDLAPGRTVTAVAAGGRHTCALLDGGDVKCWGANESGQLGLGDTAPRGTGACQMGVFLPTVPLGEAARAVAAGEAHTCALLSVSGQVRCWGSNEYGQLGVGDYTNRGDTPGSLPDALPFDPARKIVALAAGEAHTCVLDDAGHASCWGEGAAGQLGLEKLPRRDPSDPDDRDARSQTQAVDASDPYVHLDQQLTELVSGLNHLCARDAAGEVLCWGYNLLGELGLGDGRNRGALAGDMYAALPPVDLGASGAARAGALAAGGEQTCALLGGGEVKCWGANAHGERGVGDRACRGAAPDQMGDALPAILLAPAP